MSHLTKVQVKGNLTDASILKQALENIGFNNVQQHETPQELRDYYQIRHGAKQSHSSAEIVIPYEENSISSDAGFARGDDGEFRLVADSMDTRKLNQRIANLQSEYATINIERQLELITKAAKSKNLGEPIVEREVLGDGSTRIKLALPGNIRVQGQQRRISH